VLHVYTLPDSKYIALHLPNQNNSIDLKKKDLSKTVESVDIPLRKLLPTKRE